MRISDWSSDVCSSDRYGMPAFLVQTAGKGTVRFTAFEQYKLFAPGVLAVDGVKYAFALDGVAGFFAGMTEATIWTTPAVRLKILRQVKRSEERGVGKEFVSPVRSRGSQCT